MQLNAATPAEHLLCRLQQAENFASSYNIAIERKEAYTCLHLRFALPEYEAGMLGLPERQGGV